MPRVGRPRPFFFPVDPVAGVQWVAAWNSYAPRDDFWDVGPDNRPKKRES
jgi:hypothetical protein